MNKTITKLEVNGKLITSEKEILKGWSKLLPRIILRKINATNTVKTMKTL